MKQALQLRLGQHLTMTPQLQQAIRLLQLSTLELQTEIQEALDSNLMLEVDEESNEADNISNNEQNSSTAEEQLASDESNEAVAETSASGESEIPEDLPSLEALARMALADPMVGSSIDRAVRICNDIRQFGAEAVLISRIPGASHCALEGQIIGDIVREKIGLPILEIEIPPITDSIQPTVRTRLEALIETVKARPRMQRIQRRNP